jgi:hypothetical protein
MLSAPRRSRVLVPTSTARGALSIDSGWTKPRSARDSHPMGIQSNRVLFQAFFATPDRCWTWFRQFTKSSYPNVCTVCRPTGCSPTQALCGFDVPEHREVKRALPHGNSTASVCYSMRPAPATVLAHKPRDDPPRSGLVQRKGHRPRRLSDVTSTISSFRRGPVHRRVRRSVTIDSTMAFCGRRAIIR